MDAASTTPIGLREQWLQRRASMGEAVTLLGLLGDDEEPEVSVRGTANNLLVVTTTRILLLRDGAVVRAIHQSAVTDVSVVAGGRRADLCIRSREREPLWITVRPDQLGDALEALEAVQLGMPTQRLQ